ncbi:MAG: LysR family transcriptional regulator [Parvibaculaceae bacterium]|nr:LysR family transcriptional regulator [Parvibaculaceae bacterium]
MTLEQLRIFVAVAEREHVTRASEALHLTQSAVSAAVAALEAQYDTRLFDRVGRRIELTSAGHIFLEEARAVLVRASSAELALSELGSLERGAINIHASLTVASYWLPARLARFHLAHPGIRLHVSVGNTREVTDAVLAGQADIGFVEGEIDAPALSLAPIGEDRLMLVASPEHPLALKEVVELADLQSASWILREQGSGTRSELAARLKALGLEPDAFRVALELPSVEAVRAAIQAGAGIGGISNLSAEPAIKLGALAPVGPSLPPRPFHVLRHRERRPSRAAETLVSLCREAY